MFFSTSNYEEVWLWQDVCGGRNFCRGTRPRGFFAFAALSFSSSSSKAETPNDTITVDATGGHDKRRRQYRHTRDNAVNITAKVEQPGTMVAAETLVENYQVLKDSVYTKTQGYIKNYTVTGESRQGTCIR